LRGCLSVLVCVVVVYVGGFRCLCGDGCVHVGGCGWVCLRVCMSAWGFVSVGGGACACVCICACVFMCGRALACAGVGVSMCVGVLAWVLVCVRCVCGNEWGIGVVCVWVCLIV
jgi:hypothetical protein